MKKKDEKKRKSETKNRCFKECDARRSERKGCKKNSRRAEEEQIPVALTKQHARIPKLTLRGQAGSTCTRIRIQRQLALPGL